MLLSLVYEVTFKMVGIFTYFVNYYDNYSSSQTSRIHVSASTMISIDLISDVRQDLDDWKTLKVKNVKSKSDIEQLIGNSLWSVKCPKLSTSFSPTPAQFCWHQLSSNILVCPLSPGRDCSQTSLGMCEKGDGEGGLGHPIRKEKKTGCIFPAASLYVATKGESDERV